MCAENPMRSIPYDQPTMKQLRNTFRGVLIISEPFLLLENYGIRESTSPPRMCPCQSNDHLNFNDLRRCHCTVPSWFPALH